MRLSSAGILLVVGSWLAGCAGDDSDKDTCVGFECETGDPDETDGETDIDTDVETDTDTDPVVDTCQDTDGSCTDVEDTCQDTDGSCTDVEDTCQDTDGSCTDVEDTCLDTAGCGPGVPPRADDLVEGDLVITELHINPQGCSSDRAGEYIEVKNTSGQRVNLRGLQIRNGGAVFSTINQRLIVEDGDYVILRNDEPLAATCSFNLPGDFRYNRSIELDNSGGRIWLQTARGVLDLVDFRGAGWAFGPPGLVAYPGYAIHLTVEDAIANNDPANWCSADIPIGPEDFGSPYEAANGCGNPFVDTGPTDTPEDTEDTGPFGGDDTFEFETGDTDIVPAEDIRPGDLIITELMLDPDDCGTFADRGRYIELYNASGRPLNLRGLVFDWGTALNIPIDRRFNGDWIVAPGQYVTLQRKRSNQPLCYNYGHDFTFNNALSSTGRRLSVHNSQFVIDEVNFSGWTIPGGASIGLDPDFFDETQNDSQDVWCPQRIEIRGTLTDKGTPGDANDECIFDSGGGPVDDTGPIGADCFADPTRDPSNGLDANEVCPGELIITEVMIEPSDCANERAQYIEVYNNSTFAIRPEGLLVDLDGIVTPLLSRQVQRLGGAANPTVQPGTYAVFMMQTFFSYCHVFPRNHRVESGFALSRGLLRLRSGSDVVDSVDFRQAGFPNAAGQSLQLDPSVPPTNPFSNDDPFLWCSGGPTLVGNGIPAADRGTPGAVSDCTQLGDDTANTGDTVDNLDDSGDPTIDTGVDTSDTSDINDRPGLEASELTEGNLIITEVMFDPISCSSTGGANAKYIEVYNNTNQIIYPEGLRVEVGALTTGRVALAASNPSEAIQPGSYAVFGLDAGGAAFCYGSGRDFLIRNSALPTRGTDIRLYVPQATGPTQVIDAVDMTGWRMLRGASMQLAPAVPINRLSNNDESNWCPSGRPINRTAIDFGSPGNAGVCGAFPPDDTAGDSGEIVINPGDDTGGDGGGEFGIPVQDLSAGDLLITEVNSRPNCSDTRSEYLEIYNATEQTIDLFGLVVDFGAGRRITVSTHYALARNSYGLFIEGSGAPCYGRAQNVVQRFNGGWNLSIGVDNYALVWVDSTGGDVPIDTLNTVGWTPTLVGRSLQLSVDHYTFVENNVQANWCPTLVLSVYDMVADDGRSLDYGTPGRGNDACETIDTARVFETGDTDTGGEIVIDVFDPVTSLQPGDLVVTEFMVLPSDCGASLQSGQYIEVYNTTSRRVDLRGLRVEDVGGSAQVRRQAVVEPFSYAVLLNNREGESARCYGIASTAFYGSPSEYSAFLNPEGDRISLTHAGLSGSPVTVDEVDFRAGPFAPVVGAAWELSAGVLDAVDNDSVGNWCLSPQLIQGYDDRGSPGRANTCQPETIGDSDTAATQDTDTAVNSVDELQAGDLVITEILVNSAEGCGDSRAEYFELYNATARPIDLFGIQIRNSVRGNAVTVVQPLLVGPGQYVVLARFDPAGRCHLRSPDLFYPTLQFDNQGDELVIEADGRVIDRVDFRGWVIPTGSALQLSPGRTNSVVNDLQSSWCPSEVRRIPGASVDKGSPRRENPSCGFIPDTGTYVQDTTDTDGDPDTDTEPDTDLVEDDTFVPTGNGVPADNLLPGDLVITEFFAAPRDCLDGRSEYIEILNTRLEEINLQGLVIQTGSGSFTISTSTPVGPRRYALGLRADGSPNCYDLTPVADFSYTGVVLDDTGDVITLRNATRVLDVVDYNNFEPKFIGKSYVLDEDAYGAVDNDDPEVWCAATELIPGAATDLGSPGYKGDARCSTEVVVDTASDSSADTFEQIEGPIRTMDELRVGDLLITEINVDPRDCPDEYAEYVEIYNNTPDAIDLAGLTIGNGAGVTYSVARQPGRLVIGSGRTMVGRRASLLDCYSFRPDFTYGAVIMNTPSTVIWIGNETNIIDLVRWADFPPSFGRAWMLDPSELSAPAPGGLGDPLTATTFTAAYPNLDTAHWCQAYYRIPGAQSDKGNPGVPNPVCISDPTQPPHTGDYIATVDEMEVGDLVITEIMVDPTQCPDLQGEYLEIYNNGLYTVNLQGLKIRSGFNTATVTTPFELPVGEVALGRRSTSSTCYPNVVADFAYNNVSFDNAGGVVQLENVHSIIDSVDFNLLGIRPGRALALAPGLEDAVLNDTPQNWCFQAAALTPGGEDRGTPGVANTACSGSAYIVPMAQVEPGDLIISEFLYGALDCPDVSDQYLEIHNTTANAINLLGLRFEGSGGANSIRSQLIIDPGEEVVLKYPFGCLEFEADYEYIFPLFNGIDGDRFRLQRVDPITSALTLLDEVDARGWPDPMGNSYALDPSSYDDADNDDLANWCVTDVNIRRTLTGGTPGEPNDCTTDTGDEVLPPDTSGPDLRVEDTGFYELALIRFSATVAPNVFLFGNQRRQFGVATANTVNFGTNDDSGVNLTCFYEWSAQSTAVLPTAAVCPSCTFGFQVNFGPRRDLLISSGYPPSQPCDQYFASVGGTPGILPSKKIFYSPLYGGVFLQDATGQLVPYSYEANFVAGEFEFIVIPYLQPAP